MNKLIATQRHIPAGYVTTHLLQGFGPLSTKVGDEIRWGTNDDNWKLDLLTEDGNQLVDALKALPGCEEVWFANGKWDTEAVYVRVHIPSVDAKVTADTVGNLLNELFNDVTVVNLESKIA
jgi:hypothetical protein